MKSQYRLRVRKEVAGQELTFSIWVEAISKNDAERKFKMLVHSSWRWLECVKIESAVAA